MQAQIQVSKVEATGESKEEVRENESETAVKNSSVEKNETAVVADGEGGKDGGEDTPVAAPTVVEGKVKVDVALFKVQSTARCELAPY